MRMSYFIFTVFLSMATAFYGGFLWGNKNRKPKTEALRLAEKKTSIVATNAEISDIRVQTEAKFAIKSARKTVEKKDALAVLSTNAKLPGDIAHVNSLERDAMLELIQAQDEEIAAVRALNVELLIARDSWKNAYLAAKNENMVAKINYEASIAKCRTEKIRIGAISIGVGFIGGMLAK